MKEKIKDWVMVAIGVVILIQAPMGLAGPGSLPYVLLVVGAWMVIGFMAVSFFWLREFQLPPSSTAVSMGVLFGPFAWPLAYHVHHAPWTDEEKRWLREHGGTE